MIEPKGVSRRSLLVFAFSNVVSPKAVIQDTLINIVSASIVGPVGSRLINFRKRLK